MGDRPMVGRSFRFHCPAAAAVAHLAALSLAHVCSQPAHTIHTRGLQLDHTYVRLSCDNRHPPSNHRAAAASLPLFPSAFGRVVTSLSPLSGMDPFEEAFPRAHADPPVPLGGDMHSPFEFSLPPPPPAPSSRSRWDLSPAPPRDVDATIDLDLTAFMSAEEGEPSPEEGAGRMFAPASGYEEPGDDSPQPFYGSDDGGATCSSADTLAASSNEAQPYVNAYLSHGSEDARPSYNSADYASSGSGAPSCDEVQATDTHEDAHEDARAPYFHTQQSYNPNSLELEAAARAVLVASPERGGGGRNGGIGFISPSAFVHNEEAECEGDDALDGVLSEEEEESYRRAVSSPPRMQSSNVGAAAALDLLSHPQALAAAQVMVGAARLSFDYTVDLANKGSAEFIVRTQSFGASE